MSYNWNTLDKKYMHQIIAEDAVGRDLPPPIVIHHVDGNGKNNCPSNLVVCPNHEYHMLLHKRERALDACGNPDYRKCDQCGEYDDPKKMLSYGNKQRHRQKNKKCKK